MFFYEVLWVLSVLPTTLMECNTNAPNTKNFLQVLLTNVIGEACVIDISEKIQFNMDYLLSIDDVIAWEARNGRIPPECIVFLSTGLSVYFNDPKRYFGAADVNDYSTYHFPGISSISVQFL